MGKLVGDHIKVLVDAMRHTLSQGINNATVSGKGKFCVFVCFGFVKEMKKKNRPAGIVSLCRRK